MRVVLPLLFAFAAALPASGAPAKADPTEPELQRIIEKFAENESAFLLARERYTYRQTLRVEDFDGGGAAGGRYDLVSDIMQAATTEETVEDSVRAETSAPAPELGKAVPWDLIQSTARELRLSIASTPLERFEAVPDGWYLLDREVDGVDVRQIIHVLQHQRTSWEAFVTWLGKASPAERERITPESASAEFFFDCARGLVDGDGSIANFRARSNSPNLPGVPV